MTVRELTEALSLTPFHLAQPDRPVSGGYAGDLLSWVLGRAGQDAAWLTIMSNQNVAAVALMAEVSCVILTEGVAPDGDLLRRAQEKGVNLLGAGQDTFDTAARLLRGAGCRVMPPHSISFCYFKANSTQSISTIFTYTPACRPTRQRRAGTPFCFLGRSESALRRGFRLRENPRRALWRASGDMARCRFVILKRSFT